MSEQADIEVKGLPRRIKSVADQELAFAIWTREVNRYFVNHDERLDRDKHWNYQLRRELSMHVLSEKSTQALAPSFGCKPEEMGVNILVQWIGVARVHMVRYMLLALKRPDVTDDEIRTTRRVFQDMMLSYQTHLHTFHNWPEVEELQKLLGLNPNVVDVQMGI